MNPIEIINPTYPIISELSSIWLNNADLISEKLGMLMLICLLIAFGFRFFGNNTNREVLVIKAVSTVLLITVLMNVSVTVTPERKSWTTAAPNSPVQAEISSKTISKESANEANTTFDQTTGISVPQIPNPSDSQPKTVKLLAVAPLLLMSAGMDVGGYILGDKDNIEAQSFSFNSGNSLTIEGSISQTLAQAAGVIQYFAFIVLTFGFIAHTVFGGPAHFLILIFVSAVFTKVFLGFAEIPMETIFGSDAYGSQTPSLVEFAGWSSMIWTLALARMKFFGSGSTKAEQSSQGHSAAATASLSSSGAIAAKTENQAKPDLSANVEQYLSPAATLKVNQAGPAHSTELLSPGQTESAMKRIQHWLKDNF